MTAPRSLAAPSRLLGDVDQRDAEFGGSADQVLGRGGVVIGLEGGRPEDLLGELLDRFDDHALLVVGGQVEVAQVLRGTVVETLGLAASGDLGERTVGSAESLETGFGALVRDAVDRLSEVVLLRQFGPGDGRQNAHGGSDRISLERVEANRRSIAGHLGGLRVDHTVLLAHDHQFLGVGHGLHRSYSRVS